jgi:hypothetical protein
MQEEHLAIDHLKVLEDKLLVARDCSYGRSGRSLGLASDRDCIGERPWRLQYGDTRQNKQMKSKHFTNNHPLTHNVAHENLDLSSRTRGADLRQTGDKSLAVNKQSPFGDRVRSG